MVNAIDFAVRTVAGNVVRGAIAGEGGSEFLQVGSGEAVSLNISASSVLGYSRQGNDLVLQLIDGRQITLSSYFETNPGEDNRLYLSNDGEVAEVYLTDGGNGVLYANYGEADTWNKFSTVDDLRFTDDKQLAATAIAEDDTVGQALFVPGLLAGLGGSGVGAAAAVTAGAGVLGTLAGGGGGGDGDTHIDPTVDTPNTSTNQTTNTVDPEINVTGTGNPGDVVEVVIGDQTQTTTIDDDGIWGVVFTGDDLPSDGSHEAVVTVTGTDFGPVVLDGPAFVIDLTPPEVSVTEGSEAAGHIENLIDHGDGVTIAGEGEVGASIAVVIGTETQTTTVGSDGTWTVTFSQTEVVGGEYTVPVTITATDKLGNQTVITETLVVDTIPNALGFNAVASDNIINGAEAAGAVTVTGLSAAGAVVTVTLDGASQQVTTAANGSWSVTYAAGTFTAGEYDRTLTATTVDTAGNSSSASHTIRIDTTTSVSFSTDTLTADNVINNTEAAQGFVLTGSVPADTASVTVEWNGATFQGTVLNGVWEVSVPASAITSVSGTTTAIVTATDIAGNTATDAREITIDRGTSAGFNATQVGDNTISGAEASAGITLTGTAEAGAQVLVEFQDATRTVTATSNGTWSASFASAEIARGTYTETATVTATDAAGNTATSTQNINVDTEVTNFGRSSLSTGTDGVLNNAEALQGLTVTGTVEAGSSVLVNFGTAGPFQATVNGSTWSITIPSGSIPAGEANVTLTAVATDRFGNVSTQHSEVVEVDRIVTPFVRTGGTIGGDGILNAQEVSDGLTLNGTGEAGSTIVITLSNGATQTIVVGTSGTWTATFGAASLPTGDAGTSVDVTVAATDLAGNTASFTETVQIDTVAADAPNVTNIIKSTSGAEGVTGVFLDETIDNNFEFFRVGQDGSQNEITLTNNSLGSNIVQFVGTTVPEGDFLVINHADDAGNSSSSLLVANNTGNVTVDLGNTAFQNFDFTTLDLTLAPASLTITAEDLIAITGPANVLTVKGGADDHITLENATAAGTQLADDGTVFNVYTLGSDGATILLDDDIQLTI
jgi:hypothetical protein